MRTLLLLLFQLLSPKTETLCLPEATITITSYKIEVITDKDPYEAFKYIDDNVPVYLDSYNITIISSGSSYYVDDIDYKRIPKLRNIVSHGTKRRNR
jgi:hypothetical protein